jgi:hypothetical protein
MPARSSGRRPKRSATEAVGERTDDQLAAGESDEVGRDER